jgi:GDPmannose 4,6-dehydratase
MWLMLQNKTPKDYVIATNEQHSVREFIEESFNYFGESIEWIGEGIKEKGILKSSGKVVIEINEKYFRPTEVETLLGDASLAEKDLGWKPKTKFKELVRIMVDSDFNHLKHEQR